MWTGLQEREPRNLGVWVSMPHHLCCVGMRVKDGCVTLLCLRQVKDGFIPNAVPIITRYRQGLQHRSGHGHFCLLEAEKVNLLSM